MPASLFLRTPSMALFQYTWWWMNRHGRVRRISYMLAQ